MDLVQTSGEPVEDDPNGHGTQCASAAIGATRGVAVKASVLSIRIANEQGQGTKDTTIMAFKEVYKWKAKNPDRKCVVSYSMTSPGISEIVDAAAQTVIDKTDCIVVASAGNFGQNSFTGDACHYSPARVSQVITVGATRLVDDFTETLPDFSNYGPCVDIFAPGHKVTLASPERRTSEISVSGTSFSAPAVAGAVAVLLGNGIEPSTIRDVLVGTAVEGRIDSMPDSTVNLLLNVMDDRYL